MHFLRTLGLHYVKTQKNHAGARNRTNYSADVNFLVPKPKPRRSEIRVRQNRVRRGVSVFLSSTIVLCSAKIVLHGITYLQTLIVDCCLIIIVIY